MLQTENITPRRLAWIVLLLAAVGSVVCLILLRRAQKKVDALKLQVDNIVASMKLDNSLADDEPAPPPPFVPVAEEPMVVIPPPDPRTGNRDQIRAFFQEAASEGQAGENPPEPEPVVLPRISARKPPRKPKPKPEKQK